MRAGTVIGLLLLARAAWATPDPFPQIGAAYLVEADHQVIWARQAERPLPPASLTKLMTALLVLEANRPDDVVSIGADAVRESGTRLGLDPGERFRTRDLLAAALLSSANDACHALADHLAGSERSFVARMNQRARELGMHRTHFSNACGHDEEHHRASARDLYILAHELLGHPSLLEITSQPTLEIATLDRRRRYMLENKNALIGRYEGALGLKTGYTPKAGKCLVAYARRDGHSVLLILLHGRDRWWDTVDILDLAFDHARATR